MARGIRKLRTTQPKQEYFPMKFILILTTLFLSLSALSEEGFNPPPLDPGDEADVIIQDYEPMIISLISDVDKTTLSQCKELLCSFEVYGNCEVNFIDSDAACGANFIFGTFSNSDVPRILSTHIVTESAQSISCVNTVAPDRIVDALPKLGRGTGPAN